MARDANGKSNGQTNKGWQGMNFVRRDLRLALYIRDEFTCCYCGRNLKDAGPGEVALDHLIPRSSGVVDNRPTNLITVCRKCNSQRGDKPWMDYASGGARDRIETRRYQPVNRPLAKAILAGKQAAMVADVESAR